MAPQGILTADYNIIVIYSFQLSTGRKVYFGTIIPSTGVVNEDEIIMYSLFYKTGPDGDGGVRYVAGTDGPGDERITEDPFGN